ncbi:ABC transporter permease [Methylopila henanensis]|uniref:ABC transporter permease n=1 Tax=Methylopila henanensis TaxID=873516 RepID=A0ABW4K5U5_9HYPH
MTAIYDSIEEAAALERGPVQKRRRFPVVETGAAFAWIAAGAVTGLLQETGDFGYTQEFAALLTGVGATILLLAFGGRWSDGVAARLRHAAPWFTAIGFALGGWELVTAKLELLPMPFFPPPQAILEVYLDDYARLLESLAASAKLLAVGYLFGATAGFVLGVAVGWSQIVAYWTHPILRFVGPLPATAWLPLAFFLFPSSWSASTFLIALATGFPVTVLTWSGVASVHSGYYDVARTLGASRAFLVLKVAIPAALPHVFVGLFMGLGSSFAVLVVAEMLGVKAGLGWYLQWAQGWASYANMYAALIVLALGCSGLITALFKIRDRQLTWQKGVVRW